MQEFIVRKHPSEGLWYVLGKAGKYYIPISHGYKNRSDAETCRIKMPIIEHAQKLELTNI